MECEFGKGGRTHAHTHTGHLVSHADHEDCTDKNVVEESLHENSVMLLLLLEVLLCVKDVWKDFHTG